ncbi:MAG: phytoene desaturase family protein, partial [Actinomycetota bacterium]
MSESAASFTIPSSDRFDAIVIGAGHNGLVAANYLARAGLSVALFEARDTVGGCSSSESMGDVTVNICNCDHITFRTTPILEELDLAAHGLRYLDVEPSQLNLDWDGGPAWAICHSVDTTLELLSQTFPSQVDGYRRYVDDALPVARLVLAAAAAGPQRRRLLTTAARARGRGIRRLLQWSRLSAEQVFRSYFSDERVYAPALATGPVVWGLSPRLPGTGLGALTYALRHAATVGRPVGGSGSLAVALQSAFLARSGSL